MSPVFEFLFGPYRGIPTVDIVTEAVAVFFGFASVWYSKKNKIAVFPTGMISTALFVYLLWKAHLWGDMLINAYYFAMSIYGWYFWTRKNDQKVVHRISKTQTAEWRTALGLGIAAILFILTIYTLTDRWTSWVAYVDSFTTALFFVGMWLMAKRKIENWIFWIIGDVISVPLYFYKGLSLTSFQFLLFTALAVWGYRSWKKIIDNSQLTAIE